MLVPGLIIPSSTNEPKGIRGFDPEKAYQAMKTTMMQNERGLKEYKKYGYIPYSLIEESVTITLEYAFNDWCVAQMAKALEEHMI